MKAKEMYRRLVNPATSAQGQPGSSWENRAPAHPGTAQTTTCKYVDESAGYAKKVGQPATVLASQASQVAAGRNEHLSAHTGTAQTTTCKYSTVQLIRCTVGKMHSRLLSLAANVPGQPGSS
jgi:hypothetical protein